MISNALYTSRTEEWATPQDFYDRLNGEFHFTLDPCASAENAKCAKFFTKETDGLLEDWGTETVFMNPPYGKTIGSWMRKAKESARGGGDGCMPRSRPDRYSVVARERRGDRGGAVCEGTPEVWRIKKFSTISKCSDNIPPVER